MRVFPQAVIEDGMVSDKLHDMLMADADRLSFDAPVHWLDDVLDPASLRVLNIKPSRFGTLRNLFATYEHCRDQGIAAYGGGQFESWPRAAQYLASLFRPDTANDVTPRSTGCGGPGDDLPRSPLRPAADALASAGVAEDAGAPTRGRRALARPRSGRSRPPAARSARCRPSRSAAVRAAPGRTRSSPSGRSTRVTIASRSMVAGAGAASGPPLRACRRPAGSP